MRIERFQDLFVWQIADELRREIIAFTDAAPAARDFRYRDQIRDAIASVCRNTSEGFDRFRPGEFARSLEFARGSLGEVQDCLIDARERHYVDDTRFDRMWVLSKRAIGSNTNLTLYLKDCAAKGLTPWAVKTTSGNTEPSAGIQETEPRIRTKNQEPEPRTKTRTENQDQNREPRPEPRTKNREPRT